MPGVGQKSAQRIAFHLLERDRDGANDLSARAGGRRAGDWALQPMSDVHRDELCSICSAAGRDTQQLCVVESPADVMAIEDATGFRGLYFVLMGHLSPLDGIGPEELGLSQLEDWLAEGEVKELIIATNPTVEGDATAHYLADLAAQRGVRQAGSHTVFRWAASLNTSTAEPCRTRFTVAGGRLRGAE